MKVYHVSKDFTSNKYSEPALNVKAGSIISEMTGNANFPTPVPTLEVVTSANDAFTLALKNAENGTKEDTVVKNNRKQELIALLKKLADYVQLASNGDEAIIISSGFDVNKKPSTVGPLEKATGLTVSMGTNRGSVVLDCDVVKNATVYLFEYTALPLVADSIWIQKVSTKHKQQIENLTSGKEYVFRVAGAGSDPSRNWSDQISSFVL